MNSKFNINPDQPLDYAALKKHNDTFCVTCGRNIQPDGLTKHHLVPRSQKLKWQKSKTWQMSNSIIVCRRCHQAIHHFCTNQELADSYNSIWGLQSNPILADAFREIHRTGNYAKTRTALGFNLKGRERDILTG